MGAGINHAICVIAVRQVHVGASVAESELQDFHARHAKSLTQRFYVGRYQSEILGDEGQIAEGIAERYKQIVRWTVHPFSVNGSGFLRGNLPVLAEAAEVIEAHEVTRCGRPAHTLDPP